MSISTGAAHAFGAQRPAHFAAVSIRQQHVEDHGVVLVVVRALERASRVRCDIDRVRLFAEALGQHPRRIRFIFDKQHSHGDLDQ